MPQISRERIDEFIARWEEIYKEKLKPADAHIIAARLVVFYQLLRTFPPAEPAQAENDPEVA